MASPSRAILLAGLSVLVAGPAIARDWTLANGKTVVGEFKSSRNAVVYLDNGNKISFHRLVKKDQDEVRRKLIFSNSSRALDDIKRPERPVRSFLHSNGSTRMQARLLGVSTSGDVLVEANLEVYEFKLSQFSLDDQKYIRAQAKQAGDDAYLPKESAADSGTPGSRGPVAGGAGSRPRLGGGPTTGGAVNGGPNGEGSDPYAFGPPPADAGMDRRGEQFDIRDYPNYPGGANNPIGGDGPPSGNPSGGFARPGGFAPVPGSGPRMGGSGGPGQPAGDNAPRTNDLEGMDGVEFGREELPPIVIGPGHPEYEEMLAEQEARRRENEIFPMDRAPQAAGNARRQPPLFGGAAEQPPQRSPQSPFAGNRQSDETPETEETGEAEPAPRRNIMAIGVLVGAGGLMLLLGGLGVGLLIGKQK